MICNEDDTILRTQRVDPSAPWPILAQVLRIAIYDEYAAQAFYLAVLQSFGAREPFSSIAASEAMHIEALGKLCETWGVAGPINRFLGQTPVSSLWRVNLERAVWGEISNIQMYANLLQYTPQPDIRRVFERLQAASRDRHLPAFERALGRAVRLEAWHAQQGIPASQAQVRHGLLTDTLERGLALLAARHSALGLATSLLRFTDPAMLAGMATGGAAVYWMRHARPKTRHLSSKEN